MILQRLFIPEEKNITANKSHMHKFSNFWALLELYKYTTWKLKKQPHGESEHLNLAEINEN